MKRSLSQWRKNETAYKRRRTVQTLAAAKTVRNIAKKVILQQAETKVQGNDDFSNIGDNAAVYQNLTYPIAQGAGEYDRIGRKIHLTSIRVKGSFYTNTSSITNSKLFRVILLKTTQNLGTGKGSVSSLNDIFVPGTTNVVTNGMVDLKKCVKVYHDEVIYSQPFIYNTAVGVVTQSVDFQPFEFSVKINKSEFYQDDAASHLSQGDYYLIFCAFDNNVSLAPGGINYTTAVYFKDE